ncbi:MAG: outer membrane protein assembly factor BamB family protein [Streptosporangiaceae bacterium]
MRLWTRGGRGLSWSRRAGVSCAMALVASLLIPAAAGATMAATPPAATPIPTTTTLESSVTSSTYDSPVRFTVTVDSAAGGASGWVSLIDQTNGSPLAALFLAGSTATFSTSALAPGTRRIVAKYEGDSATGPSYSQVLTIPVAQVSDAVAYQIDPAHDGRQVKGPLKAASLHQKWSVTLGSKFGIRNVSYPLIAGGRVFVTVPNAAQAGSNLFALNAATGAVDWSVSLGGAGASNISKLAYDGRRVFTITGDGVLTAFVASTGHQIWTRQLGAEPLNGPPTAYDGLVYVTVWNDGGYLYAISEAGGGIRWIAPVQYAADGSPAVDYTGAYISNGCQLDYRLSLQGATLWNDNLTCGGGGGSAAVLHGSSVYVQGFGETPRILSKTSGTQVGTYTSATEPAFDKTNMYTLQNGNLVAVDPSGRPNRWTWRNGTLGPAAVISGGAIFVGGSAGKVYAISATTHNKLWTGTASSPNASSVRAMAVGGGLLLVSAGPALTAFGN